MQNFTRADRYFDVLFFAEREQQRTFEDVGELLVLVRMFRDDASFPKIDMREHHPFAGDEPAVEHVGDFLERYFAPPIVSSGICHAFNVRKKNGPPFKGARFFMRASY